LLCYLTDNPETHVDLEVEAKMKEQAIFHLMKNHPGLF